MKKVQKIGESDVYSCGWCDDCAEIRGDREPSRCRCTDALATAKAKVESCRAELKQAIGELKALKTEADDDMSAQAGRVILDRAQGL